jgi:hypothetical protein
MKLDFVVSVVDPDHHKLTKVNSRILIRIHIKVTNRICDTGPFNKKNTTAP